MARVDPASGLRHGLLNLGPPVDGRPVPDDRQPIPDRVAQIDEKREAVPPRSAGFGRTNGFTLPSAVTLPRDQQMV